MSVLIIFIQKAIVQGVCILYGALGEIMTEKSGNLNLGIPGIMYMGGIAGLMGAFLYEKDNPDPNAFIGVLISFVCAFACAMIGGLIYSILTITLRVNQTTDRSTCKRTQKRYQYTHKCIGIRIILLIEESSHQT